MVTKAVKEGMACDLDLEDLPAFGYAQRREKPLKARGLQAISKYSVLRLPQLVPSPAAGIPRKAQHAHLYAETVLTSINQSRLVQK